MDTKHPLKPLIFQLRQAPQFQAMNAVTDEGVFMSNEARYGVKSRANVGFGLWQLAYGSLNTLNETNVDTYMAVGRALKSDEGHPYNIIYDTLVVGPSNLAAAEALVDRQFDTTNNISNKYYKRFNVVVSPYLT
jgi:phage major head subunit gpT-like protein